jgi:carbohydrate kinase (thermoresistant glucokinase family)
LEVCFNDLRHLFAGQERRARLIIVLMGVSGSGKSTLGRALSAALGWHFVEGDHYHPTANVEKMRCGEALDDDDRAPWLSSLNAHLQALDRQSEDAVVACSALTERYRTRLAQGIDDLRFAYLYGSADLIRHRIESRQVHFMPTSLLASQMETLEPPTDAIGVDIAQPTAAQVDEVMRALQLQRQDPGHYRSEALVQGLAFPEAPRWHAHRLWFTDQHARAVCAVSPDGALETITATDDLPGGLGWLPDGSLLVVFMTQRRIMRFADGHLRLYADLSGLASFHCNDMLVDPQGRVYAGNFGYDLHRGAPVSPAELVRVGRDGTVDVAAGDLVFPNGCALTPDGRTLLVAETFAHRITAFDVSEDGGLDNRRVWAELDGHTPDGICLDAIGALWVASPGSRSLLRIIEGGTVIGECETLGTPYACMLGDTDRRTLYVCTSETDDPATAATRRSGRIERVRVTTPGAGLP